ncbi:hypothetical protein [Streptomyces sp. NPDC021608]|uniref:hypothetical protein n=1 Tax=Streptomyces sp. NPDC021608 TaxID=3154903 RepID=UPI0033FD05FB
MDAAVHGSVVFVAGGSPPAVRPSAASRDGRPAVASPVSPPARQRPGGDPSGDPAGGSASDGGTPRHNDAYAVVAPLHRPVPWPALGAAADSDPVATQHRYRDVPVFPG